MRPATRTDYHALLAALDMTARVGLHVGGDLAQAHVADVQAHLGRHVERGEQGVIVVRVTGRIGGGVEEQKEAVRAIDLAARDGAAATRARGGRVRSRSAGRARRPGAG